MKRFLFLKSGTILAAFYATPLFSYAQFWGPTTTFKDFAGKFLALVNVFIPVVITLALVLFLYGLARYLANADNEESRNEGKKLMIYGVISLAVMISVWGLVNVLLDTFGLSLNVHFFPSP